MTRTRSVRELMSPNIMTVADDMTTDDLARYLIEHEISGAPVVDNLGHIVGVVSMTDLGRNVAEPAQGVPSEEPSFSQDDSSDYRREEFVPRFVGDRSTPIRDVMTPVIHQVPVTASVSDVARLMVEQHIHRVVVTQEKAPVGIITSMDLLMLLAEQK